MYPTKEQEEMFFQHFGACIFIYNWGLEQKIKTYEQDGTSISRFDLNKGITMLKRDGEHDWLKDVNSQSLQGATLNLDNAFTRFFREKKGFPKFKSRNNPVQAYNVPQNYKIDFENNMIYLPKIGNVKTILHRPLGDGDLKTATVSRTSTGKYYISIFVDNGREIPEKSEFSDTNTAGIDVGIKDLAIVSNGEKFDNPLYLKNSLKRLRVFQKRLSRKQKGSSNRNKARQQNVSGMLKNHCLAQHIADASWIPFITKFEYKAEGCGKTLLRIGRFEPSTKICNVCGYYNASITLADREWDCPDCHTHHDRDINAAINIKKFALQEQNLIGI